MKNKRVLWMGAAALLLAGGLLAGLAAFGEGSPGDKVLGGRILRDGRELASGRFLETGGLLGLAAAGQRPLLLLDPGHGGLDGGAVSAEGLPEKDINLAIALEVKALAEADGWQVVLTRTEDRGLYEGVETDSNGNVTSLGGQSLRSLKTQDLKNRKAMADELQPDYAVSIHLNSYKEDTRVRGAQVFYGYKGNSAVLEESRLLAESIQAALIDGLADGNERAAMSEGGVRFLQQPSAPTVLVECGFLSCPQEAALLSEPAYQKQLAACIYKGLCTRAGLNAAPAQPAPPVTDSLPSAPASQPAPPVTDTRSAAAF